MTYLAKLARFWMTLAMRVSVREVRSSGYSCMRLKSEGDMMAGHRKRRKSDALIRRWLMSCFPRAWHCCFHDANTSFSSRGNTLTRAQQQVRMELMQLQAWAYEQTTNKSNFISSYQCKHCVLQKRILLFKTLGSAIFFVFERCFLCSLSWKILLQFKYFFLFYYNIF